MVSTILSDPYVLAFKLLSNLLMAGMEPLSPLVWSPFL